MYEADSAALPSDIMLDQLMLGSSGTDGRGLAVRATSFPDYSLRHSWDARLGEFARLTSVNGRPAPATAFSYLVFNDGMAALLRRVNRGNDKARNPSHALVGPAQVLGPRALPLTGWTGWDGEQPERDRLDRLPLPQVPRMAEQLTDRARDLAGAPAKSLRPLVRALLADPARDISVLHAADEDAVPLLWGLRQIIDPVFDGTAAERNWTFSTYEDHDGDRAYLPEVIFLPAEPYGLRQTSHDRVRLDTPLDDREGLVRLTDHLVARYRDSPEELTAWITAEVRRVRSVEERIARLTAFVDPGNGRAARPPRPRADEAPAHRHYAEAAAARPAEPPQPVVPPRRTPRRTAAPTGSTASISDVEDTLRMLAGATSRLTVLRCVESLRAQAETIDPRHRPAIRELLYEHDFFGRTLGAVLWSHERVAAFHALAESAFGPGGMDLGDGAVLSELEPLVSNPAAPPELIAELCHTARRSGGDAAFNAAVTSRWLHEHGFGRPVAPPPARPLPPARSTRGGPLVAGALMSGPKAPVLPLVLVILVLATVIVLMAAF